MTTNLESFDFCPLAMSSKSSLRITPRKTEGKRALEDIGSVLLFWKNPRTAFGRCFFLRSPCSFADYIFSSPLRVVYGQVCNMPSPDTAEHCTDSWTAWACGDAVLCDSIVSNECVRKTCSKEEHLNFKFCTESSPRIQCTVLCRYVYQSRP